MNNESFRATTAVPTIREESIKNFLQAWGKEFLKHRVIIVEDNPQKVFSY